MALVIAGYPDSTGLGQAEEGADESGEDLETGGANDPADGSRGPGQGEAMGTPRPVGCQDGTDDVISDLIFSRFPIVRFFLGCYR